MTSGDASFTAPFKLLSEHDDYIHALVAYFNVAFTVCHKMTWFSIGSTSKNTHRKQEADGAIPGRGADYVKVNPSPKA
ncbi:arginine N-methyltransferase 1 [Tanacetum coccineum]